MLFQNPSDLKPGMRHDRPSGIEKAMTKTPGSKKQGWIRHLAGAGVTVLCLYVMLRRVDIAEAVAAWRYFHWPWLVLGIASVAMGYTFRINRWSVILRAAGVSISFNKCATPFLGSIALNNVLPLRLGDVLRALVFPKAMGISRTDAAGSLVMERVMDLMTLLACLAIGLFAMQPFEIPAEIKASAISLSAAGSIVITMGVVFSTRLGGFFRRLSSGSHMGKTDGFAARLCVMISGLLLSFGAMSRPGVLSVLLLLSIPVWIGESGLFYFVLHGFGFDVTFFMALLVMSVATLATLVPSSPGYVGPFHLAAFTVVSLAGGSSSLAGSFAVMVHLVLWTSTTAAGAAALWLQPELLRAVRKKGR